MDVTDEMIEAACAAILELRGFKWPDGCDEEELTIGRQNMAVALTAALAAAPVGVKQTPAPVTHVLPPVVTDQMEIDPDVTAADLGVNAEPADPDGDQEACVVCGEHLEAGDHVYWSSNDDGHMHADCATHYVDEDGKETDSPPVPFAYRPDTAEDSTDD